MIRRPFETVAALPTQSGATIAASNHQITLVVPPGFDAHSLEPRFGAIARNIRHGHFRAGIGDGYATGPIMKDHHHPAAVRLAHRAPLPG